MLSSNLDNINDSTKLLKESMFDGYDRSIRYATKISVSVLNHHKNLADKKIITLLEAQRRAKSIIRNIRYNNGQGYFWIDDDKYNLLVHAILTDKEGMYRYDVKDPSGYYLMRNIVGKAVEQGSAYTDYLWQKPNEESDKWFEKRSYSQFFPEWNWIPGTGNYVDDIQNELNNYQNRVSQIFRDNLKKLSKDGLAIVVDENNKVIHHPNIKFEGASITDIFKQPGINMQKALFYDVGFVEFATDGKDYIGHMHKNTKTGNKFLIAKDKKVLFRQTNLILANMIFLSVLVILVGLMISIRISNAISNPITKISKAIGKISTKGLDKRIPEYKAIDELYDLAVSFNKMMAELLASNDKIDGYQKNLENKIAERTSALKDSNNQLQIKYDELEKSKKVIAKAESELRTANQELERLAVTDPLTGIANRLCFEGKLKDVWGTLKRLKHPLSVLMMDIDYFKPFNDHYGHPAGDKCLKQVSTILQSCIKRSSDLVARYGGEEFIMILPGNDINSAKNVAQIIQSAIANGQIEHLKSKVANVITLSIGVSTVIPPNKNSIESLLKMADSALYDAKKKGRNRFEVAKGAE